MLPNQAIASTLSAPRPSGAEGRGSTAPLCLQLLRTSQACTRYSAILLEITRHLPLLHVLRRAQCAAGLEGVSPRCPGPRPWWAAQEYHGIQTVGDSHQPCCGHAQILLDYCGSTAHQAHVVSQSISGWRGSERVNHPI
jgi:hypothetical protein